MGNLIKNQFKTRYFAFDCDDEEKDTFYVSQWTNNRLVYLLYRIFMWMYVFGWWLTYYIYNGIYNPNALRYSYRFMTMWGRFINTVYFSLAFALAIVGFARRNVIMSSEPASVKWLRSITWMIHSVAQTAALVITIVYWAALAPLVANAADLTTPFNIDLHAMNTVVILIDIFVVASPMRIFHVIYPMILAVIYIVATLIFHGAGDTSAVYPILDWENSPGLAAGVSVGLCFIGAPLVHSILFGLYCLRLVISKKCCVSQDAVSPAAINISDGAIDNPAFTA